MSKHCKFVLNHQITRALLQRDDLAPRPKDADSYCWSGTRWEETVHGSPVPRTQSMWLKSRVKCAGHGETAALPQDVLCLTVSQPSCRPEPWKWLPGPHWPLECHSGSA